MVYSSLPSSAWPATPSRFFLLYDVVNTNTAPVSFHASAVDVSPESATCVVTCASPCPTDFPKHTVTQVSGSSWAGEHTISGTVTSWGCNLGHGSGDVLSDQNGVCYAATAKPGETIDHKGTSTPVNSCFVAQRSALVLITAGQDRWYEYRPPYETSIDPKVLWTANESEVKSICNAVTTNAAASDQTTTAASSDKTTAASMTGSGQASQPSKTSGGPTSTSTSSGSVKISLSQVLLFGSALLGALAAV